MQHPPFVKKKKRKILQIVKMNETRQVFLLLTLSLGTANW